jgi:hypothetical protein
MAARPRSPGWPKPKAEKETLCKTEVSCDPQTDPLPKLHALRKVPDGCEGDVMRKPAACKSIVGRVCVGQVGAILLFLKILEIFSLGHF